LPRFILKHTADESVDVVLTVTSISTLNEVSSLVCESSLRIGKLEGPQDTVGSSKVGSNGPELVDEILNANDSVSAQNLLNLLVVVEGGAGTADLQVSTLVDELLDQLEGGVSPCNVWLDELEHGEGSLVQTNEDGIVDLTKTQQLEDLAGLGAHTKNTTDSGNNSNLGLLGNVDTLAVLGNGPGGVDGLAVGSVLLDVLLGTDEILLALGGSLLDSGHSVLGDLLLTGLLAGYSLANELRDNFGGELGINLAGMLANLDLRAGTQKPWDFSVRLGSSTFGGNSSSRHD